MRDDLVWTWKDEQQVLDRLDAGLTYTEEAVLFYAEAESVIAQIEARCEHFADGLARWKDWRPEATWTTRALPDGWHLEPGFDHDLNRRVPLA